MGRTTRVSVGLFLSSLLLLGCGTPQPTKTPDKVTLQLKWVHQAQFAGLYLAQDKGYYAQENIRVAFLEGGTGIDKVQRVLSGEADFGVLAPEDVLTERSEGQPLTALAAIYRRSAVVFVAMAQSGIVRPSDFAGKTIAVAATTRDSRDLELQFYAMMKRLGLDVSKVKIVPYDVTYASFYRGEVDVTAAYYTGGVIRMRQAGYALNLIWPSDYGIHSYSDTLVTTDSLIAENPGLVSRFLRATLKGWQDAVEDYQQAVTVTLRYAQQADPQLQTAMMEAMLPLVHTGEDHIGWMKPDVWQGMYDMLWEQGLLAKPFDVNQAYTLQFLEGIYGEKAQ